MIGVADSKRGDAMRHFCSILAVVAAVAGCSGENDAAPQSGPKLEEPSYQPSKVERKLAEPPVEMQVATPAVNARRGRILFVTRACVICHSVNGVGGKAAPALDAQGQSAKLNPLDFSARMWRGAPAMASLQAIELGYVIDLSAQDIADLAAFAASPDEQALLTLDSTPVNLRDWFIDDRYWEGRDWTEYLARGERLPLPEEGAVEPK